MASEEATMLNKYMNDCFVICEQNNADRYELKLRYVKVV